MLYAETESAKSHTSSMPEAEAESAKSHTTSTVTEALTESSDYLRLKRTAIVNRLATEAQTTQLLDIIIKN